MRSKVHSTAFRNASLIALIVASTMATSAFAQVKPGDFITSANARQVQGLPARSQPDSGRSRLRGYGPLLPDGVVSGAGSRRLARTRHHPLSLRRSHQVRRRLGVGAGPAADTPRQLGFPRDLDTGAEL